LAVARGIEVELRRRFAAEFATTLPKFDVMAQLSRVEQGMKMSELSRLLMVSNGNVTGIIDRLVAEMSVERLVDAGDRRATVVRLTAKGASRFAAMAAAHQDWIAQILSGYSSADSEYLFELLGRVRPPAQPRSPARAGQLGQDTATARPTQPRSTHHQRLARKRSSGGAHVR
jgi:DNA-binding MarR family transcriptional regulator